jgi:hypothetical protein
MIATSRSMTSNGLKEIDVDFIKKTLKYTKIMITDVKTFGNTLNYDYEDFSSTFYTSLSW